MDEKDVKTISDLVSGNRFVKNGTKLRKNN
jgi:hypothetical protein